MDGQTISPHFGRSACFIVFEMNGGAIDRREIRANRFTPHSRGECREGEAHHDQQHSHAGIVGALHDCEAVLCYGMGWRAAEELRANGIMPFVVDHEMTPEAAACAHAAGTLKAAGDFCRCHEGH
jgi:predicted Fe-Mo cluster-binding NifX family protein